MATLKDQSRHLEELIKQQKMSDNMTADVDSVLNAPELEQVPSFEVDYEKLYNTCRRRAKDTVDTMAAHILGKSALDEPYVKDKKKQDIITLADLYYQLELTTIVLKSNIENVRMSGGSPRLYETFVQLSKNQTEINKQVIATETVIRQTYTALKHEIITKQKEEETEMLRLNNPQENNAITAGEYVDSEEVEENVPVYRGTRQLIMDKLQEKKDVVKQLEDIEDAEVIDED